MSTKTEPSADPEMEELAVGFTEVSKAIALVGSYQNQIAGLREEYPVEEAYAVDTKEGMARAISVRAAWRGPRVALEKAREAAKAPVIRLGKLIDQRAKAIEGQLRIGESNADQQIKAKEAADEAVKESKRREAEEALAAIRRSIADAFGPPSTAHELSSAELAGLRSVVFGTAIDSERFGDLVVEAAEAKARALVWIDANVERACQREDEAERVRVLAEQLAADRARFAEEQRKETEARKQRQAEEDERLAAERARRQKEQADEDQLREHSLRLHREAMEKERAELDRQRQEQAAVEAKAEATRKAKREQEEAIKRAAEAAASRVSAAAPAMLAALTAWGSAEAQMSEVVRSNMLDDARAKRDQAVAAALGCEPVEVVYTVAKPKRARKAA